MDLRFIPFCGEFIVYRPLRPLAFVGDARMVDYIRARVAGNAPARFAAADEFLDAIRFFDPDPEAPATWQPVRSHRPTTAVMLMTSACNLRCTYCYAFGGDKPWRQLTFPLAKANIDMVCANARALGQPAFNLIFHGGGEPTANWDVLTQAVEYARAQDLACEVTMSTNGLLSRSKRDFVLANFNSVSLSFDGIREVQDAQRPTAGGGSSFDGVMDTIRAFDTARFAYGIRLTVTPEYFDRLSDSVRFLCEETACQGFQVEPTYSNGRGEHTDPDAAMSQRFIDAFRAAFELASSLGRSLTYSGSKPWSVSSSFCSAAKDALIVNPAGDLVGCFEVYDSEHPLSDEFKVGRIDLDPLARARVHIDHDAIARFAGKEAHRRDGCRDCFCYWSCAGDCATRRTASVTATSGRCHVNREITKDMLAWYIAASGGVWDGGGPAPDMAAAEVAAPLLEGALRGATTDRPR